MPRTFRRTNVGTAIAERYMVNPDDYVVIDGELKRVLPGDYPVDVWQSRGQTPEVYADKTNFRFFTDNHDGYAAPKLFRRMINRSERRCVRQEIIKALRDDMIDELVDTRMKLPYWD